MQENLCKNLAAAPAIPGFLVLAVWSFSPFNDPLSISYLEFHGD
jgi:hypothetical protein